MTNICYSLLANNECMKPKRRHTLTFLSLCNNYIVVLLFRGVTRVLVRAWIPISMHWKSFYSQRCFCVRAMSTDHVLVRDCFVLNSPLAYFSCHRKEKSSLLHYCYLDCSLEEEANKIETCIFRERFRATSDTPDR